MDTSYGVIIDFPLVVILNYIAAFFISGFLRLNTGQNVHPHLTPSIYAESGVYTKIFLNNIKQQKLCLWNMIVQSN